jgi:hypothetical protein
MIAGIYFTNNVSQPKSSRNQIRSLKRVNAVTQSWGKVQAWNCKGIFRARRAMDTVLKAAPLLGIHRLIVRCCSADEMRIIVRIPPPFTDTL